MATSPVGHYGPPQCPPVHPQGQVLQARGKKVRGPMPSLPPTLGQTGHTHISMMLGTELLKASVECRECRGEGLTWGSSNGAPKKEEGQA